MTYLDDVMRLMLAATKGEPEADRIEVVRAALRSAERRAGDHATLAEDQSWEENVTLVRHDH